MSGCGRGPGCRFQMLMFLISKPVATYTNSCEKTKTYNWVALTWDAEESDMRCIVGLGPILPRGTPGEAPGPPIPSKAYDYRSFNPLPFISL